jgi:predicted GNAT family N-acyltransferase
MSIKIKEIHAKETYDLRHQVMWPNKPKEFVILNNDEEGLHLGLWKDANLIAVVSLFTKDRCAQFRKFATKASEQGNGYGTLLLNHLMQVISKKEIQKVWCNARADKTSFYEKFGLLQTSKSFTKEGVKYIIMEKVFTSN